MWVCSHMIWEQLQPFLKILSTLSLYLHYQLLSIYFYSNSLLYFTLYINILFYYFTTWYKFQNVPLKLMLQFEDLSVNSCTNMFFHANRYTDTCVDFSNKKKKKKNTCFDNFVFLVTYPTLIIIRCFISQKRFLQINSTTCVLWRINFQDVHIPRLISLDLCVFIDFNNSFGFTP